MEKLQSGVGNRFLGGDWRNGVYRPRRSTFGWGSSGRLKKKPRHVTKFCGMKEVWICYVIRWIAWPEPRGAGQGSLVNGARK